MPTYAGINNYGDIGSRVGIHAEAKMLEHAEPVLVLNKLGDAKPMPKNKGEVIKWRRPIPLPLATTPLVEGVTPAGTQFRYEDIQATLQEYGDWMPLTNKVVDLHEDPVGSDMSRMAGEQAASTIEALTWGVVRAGTNAIFANGAARNAVNTTISLSMVRKAVRILQANKARRITSILDSSPRYNTVNVEASYVAVAHTDMEGNIRKLPGFKSIADYGNRKPIVPEELGSVENIRFICSPEFHPFRDAGGTKGLMLSTTGTAADVYPVLVMGAHAYGVVALKGLGAIKPMVRQPGKPDSNDPMGRNGSVAWNTWFASKILNDAWIVRLECAAEENPV